MQFRKLPMAMMAMAVMMAGSAQAGLIGDNVTVTVNWTGGPTADNVTVADPAIEFIGGSGSTNIGSIFLTAGESINLLDTSVVFRFLLGFQGSIVISNIDGVVTSASGSPASGVTTFTGVVSNSGHTVTINYIGGDAPSSTAPLVSTMNLVFDTGTNGGGGDVPEPTTVALMGAGLAGLAWLKRR